MTMKFVSENILSNENRTHFAYVYRIYMSVSQISRALFSKMIRYIFFSSLLNQSNISILSNFMGFMMSANKLDSIVAQRLKKKRVATHTHRSSCQYTKGTFVCWMYLLFFVQHEQKKRERKGGKEMFQIHSVLICKRQKCELSKRPQNHDVKIDKLNVQREQLKYNRQAIALSIQCRILGIFILKSFCARARSRHIYIRCVWVSDIETRILKLLMTLMNNMNCGYSH